VRASSHVLYLLSVVANTEPKQAYGGKQGFGHHHHRCSNTELFPRAMTSVTRSCHGLAPLHSSEAPDAAMLADARAPAVLAGVPDAVMLADADAGTPAVLALAPAWVICRCWRSRSPCTPSSGTFSSVDCARTK
jgi:hypothetical protein